MANVLFCAGVIIGAVTGVISYFGEGDTKRGVVAFPFYLLLAAAVARYLGF